MKEVIEEQLFELLCKKAVNGLDADEVRELEKLEKEYPEFRDDDSFELAAASLSLSAIESVEEMPANLRSKVLADSEEFFDAAKSEFQKQFEFEPKSSFWQSLGWAVAGFACIALVVNIYFTRIQFTGDRTETDRPVVQTPAPELNESEKREQFLANENNLIRAEVANADPKADIEITGDIVWSSSSQKGYMRFRGLPANDPSKSTYQLWIFDEAQDEKYPIDGGVFDINENGEIVIPIDAKINVKNPKLFAVTKEKPGGVVVSDRTGIIAVAKV